jgi:hypothetical protein
MLKVNEEIGTPKTSEFHSFHNDGPESGPDQDVIETSLARAIDKATDAGRFDVVAQLCRELEARRMARAGNVISIDSKRSKG